MTAGDRAAPRGTLAGHRLLRVTILDLGLFRVHPAGGRPGRDIGIPGFLLETDRGARILVDAGFPPDYAADPAAAVARDGMAAFGMPLRLGAGNLVTGQLGLLGLTPDDIDLVILTHSHIDHIGGLAALARPAVVMTAAERAAPRPLWFGDAAAPDWPGNPCRTIDGETDLCRGLRLVPTPGHTAGHLSLLLTRPDGGRVILAGDALNRASEPAEGYPGAWDARAAAESGARLLALARDTGAVLVYGHDPDQWPTLPKAPHAFP